MCSTASRSWRRIERSVTPVCVAEIDGAVLTFHLAGINNQNFIMRHEETGTYWQQISGKAISGPLAGKQLTLVPSDELTWALWKAEKPDGTVLNDLAPFVAGYARKDWDVRMKKAPTVISFAENGIGNRDLMLGVRAFGASRAFDYEKVLKEKLVQDRVGTEPVILVVGPDDQSVRIFQRKIPGVADIPEFYRVKPSIVHGRDDGKHLELSRLRCLRQTTRDLPPARGCGQGLLVRLAQLQSIDDCLSLTHSCRSDMIGSILDARRAGAYPARIAATISVPTATPNEMGSFGLTTNKNDPTSLDNPYAAGNPIANQIIDNTITCRSTIQMTPPRPAPSAMRIPISLVRRATV